MVKRQKEKQYQSAREYRDYSQLRSGSGLNANAGTVQRKLPFHCCGLTLTPFTDPVCTRSSTGSDKNDGVLFDNASLMEFLLEYKKDPLTGEAMSLKDIIKLHMDQDEEGRWQCPVLTKPFADHSKVVAVLCKNRKEAYVYSYEAYKELNVKPKNWLDLTTGDKFDKAKDVLILNDPDKPQRDIQSFWHIQTGRSMAQNNKNKSTNVQHSVTATRIMEQIQKQKRKQQQQEKSNASNNNPNAPKKPKIFADDVTGVQFTSGKATGSFTSTTMEVASENSIREASQEEILQSQFKLMKTTMKGEKGYVRLITNMGDLLLELHCDIVPRTCTNFLGLCEQKKYNNSKFHRLIPKFMIQGGKPADKATQESSIWGGNFVDEFDDRLKHTGSGIVSMANAGPGTNKQQFFITFQSCPHLDRKHSIFGLVIDGMNVLKEMEKIPTDKKDRPQEPLTILDTDILTNPAKEAQEKEAQRMLERSEQRQKSKQQHQSTALGKTTFKKKASSSTSATMIGKYLPKAALQSTTPDDEDETGGDDNVTIPQLTLPKVTTNKAQKSKPKTTFGDFSGW